MDQPPLPYAVRRYSDAWIDWINFVHLIMVSLLPFATAWVARTRLASSPVAFYAGLFVCIDIAYNVFERVVLAHADATQGDFVVTVLSIRANSSVVCVARQSRCFTKWQRCRITNQLRGGRLRQCSGKLETLLRGSVCVMEFIPMRYRICRW